jgi:hypothetical protein
MPSDEEIDEDEKGTRYSSANAGWTIIANDRVVVYCDKSKLTGWGDAGVPSYHTQFIAISGVVIFTSSDARKLPVTTTKRGIDASSEVFLTVKNYMRDGMKLFTDYTNKWKSDKTEERKHTAAATTVPVTEVATKIEQVASSTPFRQPRNSKSPNARVSKPALPTPSATASKPTNASIKFSKPIEEVKVVSAYLFDGDSEQSPGSVGEECFDFVRRKVKA